MALKKRGSERVQASGLIGDLLATFWELFGQSSRLWSSIRNSVEEDAEALATRLGLRLLLQVWVLVGSLIAVFGLLFWLIDSAGLPRGPVFFAGGALITSVSLLLAHFARKGFGGPEH